MLFLACRAFEVPASTVAVLDLSELLPFFGRDVVGILGYDVISRFVSRIDYEHKIIELSDPSTFKYSGKGTEIPMVFHGNTPQVKVSILLPGRVPLRPRQTLIPVRRACNLQSSSSIRTMLSRPLARLSCSRHLGSAAEATRSSLGSVESRLAHMSYTAHWHC